MGQSGGDQMGILGILALGGGLASWEVSAILRLVAATVRSMQEQFGDVVRVLLNTAPHDKAVCESLAIATTRYRNAFVPIARRLMDLGALREELDLNQAVDVFWFYFGYSGLFTLHDENEWSYERAEQWLCRAASRALLRDRTPHKNPP